LAFIIAVNTYIKAIGGIGPSAHSERKRILRRISREDLRALYSDLMKTLHEEAFYEDVFSLRRLNMLLKNEDCIDTLEKEVIQRGGVRLLCGFM